MGHILFLNNCCEGPCFDGIQEDGCGKGAHQSYLGTTRNTPVIPNCVDATGVVCSQFGLLGTDLHVLGCGGFVKMLN